jgi:hypothetical protein
MAAIPGLYRLNADRKNRPMALARMHPGWNNPLLFRG